MDIEAEINQTRGVLEIHSRIAQRIRVLQMQRAQLDAAILELHQIIAPPQEPIPPLPQGDDHEQAE